ncbi:MAG: YdcF family protein, partial [Bacteroidota bacterium]
MFFILSKILKFIVDPFNWILFLFLVGLFKLYRKNGGRAYLFASLALALVFSNPLLSNLAVRWWEPDTYPDSLIVEPYEVGILLSGATRGLDMNANRPLYGSGADRVLQTIALYKQGKIKRVLLTGGSGSVEHPEQMESYWTKKVLLDAAIPDSVIYVEHQSRNTWENAKLSAELLKGNHELSGRKLLITSAFHMNRAQACFKKAGLEFDIYPVESGKNIITWNPYRI